eukprot:356917-Chlamydomonas_euryale.AAC.10
MGWARERLHDCIAARLHACMLGCVTAWPHGHIGAILRHALCAGRMVTAVEAFLCWKLCASRSDSGLLRSWRCVVQGWVRWRCGCGSVVYRGAGGVRCGAVWAGKCGGGVVDM